MLSYRSAPSGSDKWLGPDVREVIREVAARGFKAVVVCPVPTLIENVEVFQETGEDAQEAARQCGLEFVRTELLNDSADMLDLLESLVREAVDQAQPTGGASGGVWPGTIKARGGLSTEDRENCEDIHHFLRGVSFWRCP